METQSQQLTNDEIFEVLSNTRRRQVIFLLYNQSGQANLGDLAETIATVEEGAEPTTEQYKRVYISLYQTHVPKLEDYGIVEYDSETKLLELTDSVDQLIAVFETEVDRIVWWKYYAAIAFLAAILAVSVAVMYPNNSSLVLIGAAVPILALLVLILVHVYTVKQQTSVPLERLMD